MLRYMIMPMLCILIACTSSNAQKNLTIGDILPNVDDGRIINYNGSIVDFNALKGKAVIIDFWATWCGSCIANMPKMAGIQKAFENDLEVLYVTYQDIPTVLSFLEKREDIKALDLNIIASDSTLSDYFPYKLLPHVVWIDKDQRIRAITEASVVNKENVQTLISGEKLSLPIKRDIVDFDYHEPFTLIKDLSLGQGLLSYSAITRHIEGLASRRGFSYPNDESIRIFAFNQSVYSLYLVAYRFQLSHIPQFYKNRFIVAPQVAAYIEKEGFICYEAILNKKNDEDLKQQLSSKMKTDLDDFFGVNSSIRVEEMECLVLSRDEDVNPSSVVDYNKPSSRKIDFSEKSGDQVVAFLNDYYDSDLPFVIDDDNKHGFLFELVAEKGSIESLRRQLSVFGWTLLKKKARTEVIVISE